MLLKDKIFNIIIKETNQSKSKLNIYTTIRVIFYGCYPKKAFFQLKLTNEIELNNNRLIVHTTYK